MAIKWRCQHCQALINVPLGLLGKSGPCPKCRASIVFPSTSLASEPQQRWTGRQIFDGLFAFMLALILHVVFLFVAPFIILGSQVVGEPGVQEVVIAELPKAEQLQKGQEAPLDVEHKSAEPASAIHVTESLEAASPVANLGGGEAGASDDASPLAGIAGEGDGGFDKLPGGPGGGTAGFGGKASFMGLAGVGRRIMIIADNSGSMSDQGKLEKAKAEILKTLRELNPGTQFCVIFFNSGPVPMPGNKWFKAKADLGEAELWIKKIYATGGTEPLSAFELAFQMTPRPDLIFFMTDGQFDPAIVQGIATLNSASKGKKATINTISFVDKSGAPLLQSISAQSGGRYHHATLKNP